MVRYNKQYMSAADDWEFLQPREQRDILRTIGYHGAGSTEWDNLPKWAQQELERSYPDTLNPDETMILQEGQDYHCNPGEEWVPSFKKNDGTRVKGFCRKKRGRY